jgi:hypothetical protein
LKAEDFIQAKVRESRLSNLHPIYGFTKGTSPTEESSLLLSNGLFRLSEVEQIEAEDFPLDWARDGKPASGMNSSPEQSTKASAVVAEHAIVLATANPMEDGINRIDAQEAGKADPGLVHIAMETAVTEQLVAADALHQQADLTEVGEDQDASEASGDSGMCTAGITEPDNSKVFPELGSVEWRRKNARAAANARHGQPGGSRDKRRMMQEIWAKGNYSSRDVCAEQECAGLDMSISSARKALVNAPEPSTRCQAKANHY